MTKTRVLIYDFDGTIVSKNTGSEFYFLTDLHAPRGQVLAIDVEHPARECWRTLIPEAADTLEDVTLVHDEFVLVLGLAHTELIQGQVAFVLVMQILQISQLSKKNVQPHKRIVFVSSLQIQTKLFVITKPIIHRQV